MTAPEREHAASSWPALVAIGAAVLCCAGPALVAVLASAGIGAVARSAAPLTMGLGVATALAIAALAWRRRRACACSDVPASSRGGASRPTDEGKADPGPTLTRVP